MNSNTNPDLYVVTAWTVIAGVSFAVAVVSAMLGNYRQVGVAFLRLTVMLVMMGMEA